MTKIQNDTYLACHMERLAKETSSSTRRLPLLQCAAHAASANMIEQAYSSTNKGVSGYIKSFKQSQVAYGDQLSHFLEY